MRTYEQRLFQWHHEMRVHTALEEPSRAADMQQGFDLWSLPDGSPVVFGTEGIDGFLTWLKVRYPDEWDVHLADLCFFYGVADEVALRHHLRGA